MEYDKYSTDQVWAGNDLRAEGQDRPANALESLAATLGDIEDRLRKSSGYAVETANRVFGGPTPITTASANRGEAPREPASIPALHSRLERIHLTIGELDGALGRLAGL